MHCGGEIQKALYPGNMVSFYMCNAKYVFRGLKKVHLKASEGMYVWWCINFYIQ